MIVVFHVIATLMELFKTSDAIASWHYPGEYVIGIGNVPLFAGFMYSAVGSYIARVWRIFDFQYSHYPPVWLTVLLAVAIYLNFFTHHYMFDLRWLLLAACVAMFFRCHIYFKIDRVHRSMPLLLGWLLVAHFIWFAENISTFANVWIYPTQREGWQPVAPAMLVSWYLLMLVSFVLVSLVNPPQSMAISGTAHKKAPGRSQVPGGRETQ